MKKINPLTSLVISLVIACAFCVLLFSPITMHASTISASNGLSPQVLKAAINGYDWAEKNGKVQNKSVLTVIDFSVPSYKKRLWVIDLKTGRVLMNLHVAQGKNTGAVSAQHFSNAPGSRESAPGIYTTADEYIGEHGKSMRVNGLEEGINSNAKSRAVVIHPAWYMTPDFIKKNGYAGRSWGCFALNPARIDQFMNLVKGGSVLFAYAASEKQDPLVNHDLSGTGAELYAELTDNSLYERLFG